MATTTSTTTVRSIETPEEPRAERRIKIRELLWYIPMILMALFLFAPFILSVLGSFKSNAEVISYPPTLFPTEWHFENWPRFFQADVGGEARLDGAASLGLMTGLFTTFLTLLLTGLSTEITKERVSRSIGVLISVVLAVIAGGLAAYYLHLRTGADWTEWLSVGLAFAVLILIGVLLLAMSRPDWRRVIMALGWSLALGIVVTLVVEQIAMLAGGGRFMRWLFNTSLLSVMMACFQLLFCAMSAYAFARLRFPGREIIFSFMLATMMIPGAVTLVPAYVLMSKLDWINRAYSLIIPGLVNAASIFLLTQFLKAVPRDLEEAAYIDGASYFQTFKDVIIPLSRPALLTVFILQFQAMWNNYLTPLLYLQRRDMWVLNVALNIFKGQYRAELNLLLVAAVINAIPVLLLFFLFSRYYIEGVSYAGVKG